MHIWRFSKSMRSLDRQVTSRSRWGSFTLTHNPTKFDGHWRFEIGYNVITWYMSHVTRWLWSTQLKLQLAKIGSHCPSEGEIKPFKKILWSHDQWVTWLLGWDTPKLNHKGYIKSSRTQQQKDMYCKLVQACVTNWGSFVLLQIRANVVTN